MRKLFFALIPLLFLGSLASAVDIDSCQYLQSNTEYRLVSNINYELGSPCFDIGSELEGKHNITLNLNGHKIKSMSKPFRIQYSSDILIKNGSVEGRFGGEGIFFSKGITVEDLIINDTYKTEFALWQVSDVLIENSEIIGYITAYANVQAIIKNMTFYENNNFYGNASVVIDEFEGVQQIKIINSKTYTEVGLVFLRTAPFNMFVYNINSPKFNEFTYYGNNNYPGQLIRFINQKEFSFVVKDKNTGLGIPAKIDVIDRFGNRESLATDDNGTAETFLTDYTFTDYYDTNTTEYYSNYTITASAGSASQTKTINVTDSEPVSTIEFNLEFPQQELPQCTIAQMLDLNKDGDVNAKDIRVIVDFIVGRPVDISSTKNCNALNLFIP